MANIEFKKYCKNDYANYEVYYTTVEEEIAIWLNENSLFKRWCFFGDINDVIYIDVDDFLNDFSSDPKIVCVQFKFLECDSMEAKSILDGLNKSQIIPVKI